ncbi:MAG: leucyl aminopeptidase [Candidatus Eisenbacteria bacterium]
MDVYLRRADFARRAVGMLAVGVLQGGKLTGAALAFDRATKGALTALLKSEDFTGKHLETALLWPRGVKAKRVLLVGLGKADALTPQRVLLAAAQAARRAREMSAGTLAIALQTRGAFDEAAACAAAEGAVLGHYRHTAYKSESKPPLEEIELWTTGRTGDDLAIAAARGELRGEATCLARDLANTPGQDLVPQMLADRAVEIANTVGAGVTVLDEAAMERLGMGCVLAVGRGSAHPPRFVVLDAAPTRRARGAKARKVTTVVVIGKGVTFDTGGYSLKPRDGMSKMKYDMSGAAAVLGLFASLPTLDLPFRVVGLIPSAENMVNSRAMKPGDIVRALDGTTVEVKNTDAEGRLLLADALGYAKRFKPDVVVDLATLTGAITVALGRAAAGLFTRNDALAAELTAAGDAVSERLWRMPLWDDFLTEMKGDTADLVNSSERSEGASCTAAAFLEHFAKDLNWAHLDIASTAWTFAERADSPKGANAFGTRLLVKWLEGMAG